MAPKLCCCAYWKTDRPKAVVKEADATLTTFYVTERKLACVVQPRSRTHRAPIHSHSLSVSVRRQNDQHRKRLWRRRRPSVIGNISMAAAAAAAATESFVLLLLLSPPLKCVVSDKFGIEISSAWNGNMGTEKVGVGICDNGICYNIVCEEKTDSVNMESVRMEWTGLGRILAGILPPVQCTFTWSQCTFSNWNWLNSSLA